MLLFQQADNNSLCTVIGFNLYFYAQDHNSPVQSREENDMGQSQLRVIHIQ